MPAPYDFRGYPALGMAPSPLPGTPTQVGDASTAVWDQPGAGVYDNLSAQSSQPGPTSFLNMTPPAMPNPPLPPRRPVQQVLRNPVVNAPLPPVRPNLNVPVGQVAGSGTGTLWDALRALFSGQPSAQGQGMTGMLQPRGQAGPGTDALGNPFNRFG